VTLRGVGVLARVSEQGRGRGRARTGPQRGASREDRKRSENEAHGLRSQRPR